MVELDENDLVQMSVKFKNSQLARLSLIQEECGFATFSETVRYVVQKGLVLIEREKAILQGGCQCSGENCEEAAAE